VRVCALNPYFNQGTELLSALEEFRRFSRCRDLHPGVVDHIPLAPAAIEEQHQLIGLLPMGSTPTQHSACSVQSQSHGVLSIFTTACWATRVRVGQGTLRSSTGGRLARDGHSSSFSESQLVHIANALTDPDSVIIPDP
jgi:hypothetical protein